MTDTRKGIEYMGTFLQGKLTDGILAECYEKVIHTLVDTIDTNEHVRSYMGKYDENIYYFAEPEFSGKYLDLCSKIYGRYKDQKALANATKVVESILENMDQDGYIGCYIKEQEFKAFSVWNQMFTVMGLLSYYRVTGYEESIKASEKCVCYIMDHFVEKGVDIFDCLNNGTQHSCILFVLSDLYQITGKEKYKDYMLYIIERFKNSDLNFLEFNDIFELRSQKGIEILIILIAILKYAELFDDKKAIESVKKYWQQVHDTQIRNTGNATMNEVWTKNGNTAAMLGKDQKPNETCVAVGWIEISLYLFKLTREAKYLNVIDKTIYNHILASISESGDDFAYYQPNYGSKERATYTEQYKCCRYRGFTLFTYMPEMLCYEDDEYIIPLLYTNAEIFSNGVKIVEKTGYPFGNDLEFTIDSDKLINKKLKLRLPEGYELTEFIVNGAAVLPDAEGGYVVFNLNEGQHYDVRLCFKAKIIVEKGTIDQKEVAAISYGQVLLAIKDENGDICISKDNIAIEQLDNSDLAYIRFGGKGIKNGAKINIEFTDYASADGYRVWIPLL